jgi:quercetin dioxygenase-like cupin family protein
MRMPALAVLALAAPALAADVTYLPSAEVAAAFARGGVLVKADGFQVHASRREAPGQAEVHAKETDVIYVLDGSATFVTGGTTVDPKPTDPDELRGASIDGGESRRLVPGDVIVVPKGVPHWFKAVDGPFTYYVVKVQ